MVSQRCRSNFFLTYDVAALYTTEFQQRYAEADALYERCQKIEEKVLGPDDPSLATTLNNRGSLLEKQVRAARSRRVVSCG